MDVLAAQCFVWFIGGYETSSITLTFTFFELAQNKTVQTRAQEEIDAVLGKHGGELTYEVLQEMTYLDMIVSGWFLANGSRHDKKKKKYKDVHVET